MSRTFAARKRLLKKEVVQLHRGPRLVFRLSTSTLADAILHKCILLAFVPALEVLRRRSPWPEFLCTYGLFLYLGKAMSPDNESDLEDSGNKHPPRDSHHIRSWEFDKQGHESPRFLRQLSSEGSAPANGKIRCFLWPAMDPEGFYMLLYDKSINFVPGRAIYCQYPPIHSLFHTLLHLLSCRRETSEASRRRRLCKSRPSQLISARRCRSIPFQVNRKALQW